MTSDEERMALLAGRPLEALEPDELVQVARWTELLADPETWEEPPGEPLLQTLGFLIGVPLLVIVAVWIAVYLPSMMRSQSSEPALAFQERNEWFGGPRKGLESSTTPPSDDSGPKGGASAQW